MKIFVINLERNIQKKLTITNILNKYTNDFEFVKAIDGNLLKDDAYNINLDFYNPCNNRHITRGEIGCALSHFSIWENIVNKNIESCLILEDDIVVKNEDFLSAVTSINPNCYDLIYLSRKKQLDIPEESAINIHPHLVKPNFSYWTCAYMLTLSGAKKLCSQDYRNNIIAVDEYVPYISCHSNHFNPVIHAKLDKFYGHLKDKSFRCYAFEPQFMSPNNMAFTYSQTFHSSPCLQFRKDITCVTIATNDNDCYRRYITSCEIYGVKPIVLGMGHDWKGGNMINGPGGGHKINLFKEYLNTIDTNQLIIFSDSYDVIMNNHINILIAKYHELFEDKIVFAADTACWPDVNLSNAYPNLSTKYCDLSTKYLNSGVFIGYSDDIKNIVKRHINNEEDDQLYYTYEFLYNNKNKINIDYQCELFICIEGLTNKIFIDKNVNCISYNDNRACFVHGNGSESTKIFFNNIITNYCLHYNDTYGMYYDDKQLSYNNIKNTSTTPNIIFVLHEIPHFTNIDTWLQCIHDIQFVKENVLILFTYINKQAKTIFENKFTNYQYNTYAIKINDNDNVWDSVIQYLKHIDIDYEFIFYCKSNSILTNHNVLNDMLSQGKNIISPLLVKCNTVYSNFWGDVNDLGYYKRSINYFDIVERKIVGCWNVPYVADTLLIHRKYINITNFTNDNAKYHINDPDIIFCKTIRDMYDFMYVLNNDNYGYIDDAITLNTINVDKQRWESKYLHEKFNPNDIYSTHIELCQDVHYLQVFNDTFCKEMINLAENNNNWSSGGDSHYDERLNAIENYPTKDIQLYDLNVEDMWKKIIQYYIAPFMWAHYKFTTKEHNISFIVKYSLDGQCELKPHHDSSSYTVNLCMNNQFTGGGCKFIKQNKIINNKNIGSLILHPGKITHYHGGLAITSGVRYLLVSFIN